ncbi:MAG: hypothetical protein LBO74_15280 [Candidatus Symbiothrix sp.]|jgi:hypothetical protein|nr:hypothetical protein [Candidatus Symbiothrix sp.]
MKKVMPTLVLKDNSLDALQFLQFARTLPYIDIIEDFEKAVPGFKKSVADTLKKTEQGKELVVCKNAEDMFNKLDI